MNDLYEIASNLYDGGWTSKDAEEMASFYEMSLDDANEICACIKEMEV